MNDDQRKRIYQSVMEWVDHPDCPCELDPRIFKKCCAEKFNLNFNEEIEPPAPIPDNITVTL